MLAGLLSRHRRFAIASVAFGLLAITEVASSQVTIQFGRNGGYGYGNPQRGYGYNPYRGSGYNPYAGGGYNRGSHNDWYYDRYQPRRFGGGRRGGYQWDAYRNPGLYGPGGPYQGYGYGHR